MIDFKILKMFEDVEMPKKATAGSSGFDISAYLYDDYSSEKVSSIIVQPFQRILITTGLKFEIPKGHEVQIRPRSGLSIQYGITLINCVGTIDEDYKGEIKIPIINLSYGTFELKNGMRIAQGILSPIIKYNISEVKDLTSSERGEGGFGSTGKF